jgi:uncharacterized protein (TIGR03435 family)
MSRLFRVCCVIVALLIVSLLVLGQGAQFEVASIKPAGPLTGDVTLGLRADGAQVHISLASIKDLMYIGYHIRRYQISGPDWLGADKFDVDAKIPEGVSLQESAPALRGGDLRGSKQRAIAEMMQNLLKDRFGLKTHWDKKELSVYTLELAKPAPEITEASPPEKEVFFPMGNIRNGSTIVDWGSGSRFTFADNVLDAKKLNMDQFTEWLGNFMDKPVVDKTGLKGFYDFSMKLSPEDFRSMFIWAALNGGSNIPPELLPRLDGLSLDSLTSGLKKLGLKLDRGKAPVDVLFIDAVEKKPTEN